MIGEHKQLESALQRQILDYLQTLGRDWYGIKVHVSAYQSQGEPDIVGVFRGHFVAFELKRPGQKPTQLQAYKLKCITNAGGVARKINSLDEVKEVLNELQRI